MQGKAVQALANAARDGALTFVEVEAAIDRLLTHERAFILRYIEQVVCGFRNDHYTAPYSELRFDPKD